jgi:argininosuccinate lyase
MNEDTKKLWGGRFDSPTSSIMERIGESISFDFRLYKQDIRGSIAHCKNLEKIGVLTEREKNAIIGGLEQIEKEIEENKLPFKLSLEDIHMHIEARLTELIGDTGKKLHTARSRNDQVAQDVRLYLQDGIKEIKAKIFLLLESFYQKAISSIDIVMPGYTHLQVAQPIRVSHYLLSHFWAIQRDFDQFEFTLSVNNRLVLGSGALAGVNYPTDREFLAKELGLPSITENSIDSVSQRDHILNFLFASSQLMTHLSRICEEIIIFSSIEYSFLSLPDSLTTGSSIMPQKKNPDIAELIRGKSARVTSNLMHMFGLLKGLPLSYNRDLQEDKIPLFDSLDQTLISIEGVTEMVKGMKFNPENMQNSLAKGFATATDLADYLVSEKGIPFREAHELTGRLVSICVLHGWTLFTIPESNRREITEYFTGDSYEKAISLPLSTDKKNVFGGTNLQRQQEQLKLAEELLERYKKKL